jgi:DNA-binding transcriptional LysR family regulator
MQTVHDAPTDLTFLYLLEALYEERSVTGAANRLGLSQPALSHALARLRGRFGDQLFVKTSSGMQPTPLAERLALSSSRALQVVRQEILRTVPFDPRRSERSFTICLSDMGGAVLLHRIVKRIAADAPKVRIRPLQVLPEEIAAQLEAGAIDLAIGYYPNILGPLYQQSLFRRAHVCIVRSGHPKIRSTLSVRQFVETPHVLPTIMSGANKYVDVALRKMGLSRNIAVEVPYLLAVPNIIAETDYIAMVPGELAELSQKVASVRILPMPVKLPMLVVKQYWHRRFHTDSDGKWLRSTIAATLGE